MTQPTATFKDSVRTILRDRLLDAAAAITAGEGWGSVTMAKIADEVGVILGLVAVVMATLGDLCESVIKRDLGIKDMSAIIPGHGGLMDRLDSLLATAAPTYLILFYLVPVA